MVNQEFTIVSMNRRAENLFGYEPDELLGKPLSSIIPKRFQKSHEKHVSEYFSKGKKGKMAKGRVLYGVKSVARSFPWKLD